MRRPLIQAKVVLVQGELSQGGPVNLRVMDAPSDDEEPGPDPDNARPPTRGELWIDTTSTPEHAKATFLDVAEQWFNAEVLPYFRQLRPHP